MKIRSKHILIILLIGNFSILIKYLFDHFTIQCEPCLPDMPCLPCATKFMRNVGWYLLIWNSVSIISYFIIKKVNQILDKKIPKDILKKLKVDYKNPDDYNEALNIVNHVKSATLNVGWIQLTRSMLILSKGDIQKLKKLLESDYMGDPRDLIMEMMRKPDSNNYYGQTPFKI